ncbi:hypothetical protein LLH23_17790 [bacterium]|nr:hypothetical protein [bacterium]
MRDRDAGVKEAEELRCIGGSAAEGLRLQVLIAMLYRQPDEQQYAETALLKLGPAAVEALLDELSSSCSTWASFQFTRGLGLSVASGARSRAVAVARLLGEIGDARAAGALRGVLSRYDDEGIRAGCVRALAALRDADAADLFLEHIRRPFHSEELFVAACYAAAAVGDVRAVDEIRRSVKSYCNDAARTTADLRPRYAHHVWSAGTGALRVLGVDEDTIGKLREPTTKA